MDAESNLTEKSPVSSNSAPPPTEPMDPAVLKEKVADELKSAATLKGGGDGVAPSTDSIPLEKDDLLERLDKIDTGNSETAKTTTATGGSNSDNDVDMENDDLIQRLEAIEKGEEQSSATASSECKEKKEDPTPSVDVNHQNGLEATSEADSVVSDDKNEPESMEVDGAAVKKNDDAVTTVEETPNGDSGEPSHSAKRRHSEDDEALERCSKKIHVEEEEVAVDKPAENTEPEQHNEPKVEELPKCAALEEKVVETQKVEETNEKTSTPEVSVTAVDDKPNQEEAAPPKNESDLPSGSDKEKTETPATAVATELIENEKEEHDKVDSLATPALESETNSDEDKLLESDSKSTESDDVEPSTESGKPVDAIVDEEKLLSEEAQAVEEQQSEPTDSTGEKPSVETKTDEVDGKSKEAVEEPLPTQMDKDVRESTDPIVTQEEKKSEDEVTVEPTTSKPEEDVPKSIETTESSPEQTSDDLPQSEAQSKPEPLSDSEANRATESSVEDQPTSSLSVPEGNKNEDRISSSSEPKEVAAPNSSEAMEKSPEPDAVTSSDERPSVESHADVPVESVPDEATVAAKSDEAMEVDAEPNDEPAKAEVVEPVCEKKEIYECTDEEKEVSKSTSETESASTSTSKPVPAELAPEEEAMEVDSAAVEPTQSKSSDGDVTESLNTTGEELMETLTKSDDTATDADSQTEVTGSAHNKNLDSTDGPESVSKVETSKTLDDSIECSLPTSSSDKLANRLKQRLDLISNGSSTPNTAVSSSNVYNSTPIQKQFEVSSEDVSKITRPSVDNSRQDESHEHSAIVADNSTVDEKDATVASTSGVPGSSEMEKQLPIASEETTTAVSVNITESSLKTESSEVDSCTASSGLSTAEEINLYASNARKFNGISSTSELDEKPAPAPADITTADTAAATTSSTVNKLELSTALTSEEATYEVNIWYDGKELQFLSVEKLEHKLSSTGSAGAISTQDLTSNDSSKQSSNGSVGSLGPFSLPPPRPAADSVLSHSSTTESSSGGTGQLKDAFVKSKHTVRGAKALASLMIEEFSKIKRELCKDDEDVSDNEQDKSTTAKTSRGRPSSAAKKTGRKRTHTESDAAEEDELKSKQPAAKQAKKSNQKELSATPEPVKESPEEYLCCCLARWSDRKYYAGKVTAYKGDNKYMIRFEDGASKALSKDVIVIGDKDTLPIRDHSVHALTGGDTYEPGFVTDIKRNEHNEVVYVVALGDKTVEVTASDMYLNEEQARAINKACKAVELPEELLPQSPQTGGKRGGSASNTPILRTPEESSTASDKGSRSTRSKRGGAADKPQTPATPEAGYSGGVGKKGGRRGRRLS
ncbi:proteoglycan 4-like isoform X2 [Sabethes cyaneus]|uniref:proteoglycan 4-like isoform X2 n=1 Tax=Sabethes cyaneus TaxID=53552 RepID=UPI00237ECFB3|nr:proteoglycan 4-like isoform X2 [Sabethes cyaneus]